MNDRKALGSAGLDHSNLIEVAAMLELENPWQFALKQIQRNLERVRDVGEQKGVEEIERGTGRTTRMKLHAAYLVAQGKPVTLLTDSFRDRPQTMAEIVAREIEQMAAELQLKTWQKHGFPEVRTASAALLKTTRSVLRPGETVMADHLNGSGFFDR